MPRPLPRRVSSSLPPPPRRTYAPSLLDESEPDDYFQARGRRSSHHAGHAPSDYYNPRRRAESPSHYHEKQRHDRDSRGRYRPSSPDSHSTHHHPRHASSSRYHDPRDDEDRGRAPRPRSRPAQSLDNRHRRRFSSRASSASSSRPSPASSRSSSTDSSLSSHHHGAGHRQHGHQSRRKSTAASNHKPNDRHYPPSASRTSRSTAPPPKRGPLHRLRSLSVPAAVMASKRSRSGSRSPSPPPSRNPLHNLKTHIKSPRDQPPEKRSPKEVFFRAAQCAAEAGAMAALKLRDDPSPWIGPNGKAPKVAAAALSAAAVDTFMEQRHPKRKGGIRHTVMRQVTQMAIGNLVKHGPMSGAAHETAGGKGSSGGAGGKGRPAVGRSGGKGGGGRVHAGGGGGRRK